MSFVKRKIYRRFTKAEMENAADLFTFGPAMQEQNGLLLKGDRLEACRISEARR
jgi:hypothetical protein